MELGKNEHFLLDTSDFGDPADDDILPKLTPATVHYSTLNEARRAYKVDKQLIEDSRIKPESTFAQDVRAGAHRAIEDFKNTNVLTTSKVLAKTAINEMFDGYFFPDATREKARDYLIAQSNHLRAQREALRFNEEVEGTADSITSNLSAGATQVVTQGVAAGLAGLATGGIGAAGYIAATTGAQEAFSKLQEWQEDYQNKHNGSLEGFEYTKEGTAALAHGSVSGAIEAMLGVERMFTPLVKAAIKKGLVKAAVQNALGEGAEEALQEASGYVAGLYVGHDNRSKGEFLQDALTNATYGAVLGGAFGAGMYKINKVRMESRLQSDFGFTPDEARQATDEMIEQGTQKVMNEVIVRNQLQDAYGDSYNALVNKIESVMTEAGWQEKYPDRDLNKYANTVAADFGMRYIKTAEQLGVSVNDVIDMSNIVAQGNQLLLETPNINDPEALSKQIKAKEAEIKEINKLVRNKKTARKTDLKDQIKILKNRLEVLGFRDKVNNVRNSHSKAMIDQGTLASTAPELIPDLQSIEQADVNDKFVYVGNSRVGVNYVVMPLSEVQGRGTTTDVTERANNFKPEEVLESPNTQYGAPVVNQNREVISGNGRLEVIRKAYELGKMDNYINLLNKLGYNTQGIENPVLVRQVGNLTPEQQLAIAQASNVSETSAFDHARQAFNDAKRLTKDINNHLAFADSLPVQERQKYIRENGNYDELALQRRFDDAVLAYILGDTKTFESLVLGNRISQKIASALSQKGSMIIEVDRNFKDLGLKEDLRKALIKSALTRNKANFINSIQQTDIEEGDEFASNSFLYAMTFSNTSSQLSQFIDEYLTRQRGYQDSLVDSFLAESLPKLSKNDIMSQTLRASQITEGKFNEDNTTSDANLKALFLSQIPAENTGYGTTNIEDDTRLFQTDVDDRDLVVYHSISAENLSRAIDFGGFPVPSLAIVKKDQEFHFDNLPITLVGNREMIDPYYDSNEVYNRDVWTKTFPQVSYKTPSYAKIEKFKEKLNPYYKETSGEGELGSFTYVASRGNPSAALSEFASSSGAILYYLRNVKKQDVELVQKDVASDILSSAGINEELASKVRGLDKEADREEIGKAYLAFKEKEIKEKFSKVEDKSKREKFIKILLESVREDKFDKDGKLYFSVADTIVNAAINYYLAKGKTAVDNYDARHQLRELIKDDDNYMEWATDFFEKELVGDKMVEVGQKLKPFTLENVVDAMIIGKTVASQDTPLPTMGKVIASGAKKLESIRDIKEESKKLVSFEKSRENMEEVTTSLYEFLDMFAKGDDFQENMDRKEAVAIALARVVKNKNITKESLISSLRKELPSEKYFSDTIVANGIEVAKKIKELSRYYFEAKPQRAIKLQEFSGAIIPTDAEFDEIAQKVQENGLKVVRSDNQVEALHEFENVLFQGYRQNDNGYFDQELKTIVIGSNFNFGTLPHELAHFWLDKVFNIWKRGSTSQAFNEDFNRLAEILNISPEQTSLTRDQQEQFASMVEGYIFNRAAFPNGTKPILDLYTNWIPPQYNSLLDIGFKDSKGMIYNPIFNEKSKQYFDDMYSALAGLREPPMALMFRPEDDDKPADKEVQEARLKALDEGETPTVEPIKTQAVREAEQDIATKSDPIFNEAYESAIEVAEAAPKTLKKKIESIVRPGRGTNTRADMDEAAQNFINENPELAEEIAFDNEVENTSGVDRAVLIINLMEKYSRNSPEYRELYHNLAITRSLAGKTGGLTNDINQSFYLNGYSQIVNRMREKAAVVKYGRRKNAVDLWEKDVDSFVQRNVEKILRTQEGTRERKAAIEAVMTLAKEEFALEDKSVKLLQTELNRLKRGKRNNQYFRNFATRYLKKYVEEVAGGRPNDVDLSKLMELSVKAQNAQNLLDSSNDAEAVAASLAVREWQDFVSHTGIKPGKIDKFVGQYLPRAMLSGVSTHVVNNVSNTSSALTTMAATRFYYGKNIIPKDVQKKEYDRINKIFKATGMNMAQIGSAKEVSKIHGEEYLLAQNPNAWQKLDPMRLLAWEDMLFRSRIYVDTLGKIASKDAKGDVNEAVRLFNEYKKINSTDDTARAKRIEALTACSLAVFQKDGTLAKLVSNTRNALDLINLEAFGQAGHKGLGTMLAPFAKTPANIVGMGLEALGSPFKLLYRTGQKIAGRDVKLVNSINEAIALANFLPSAAIVLAMLAAAGDYEEPYQPPMPYDPNKPYDSIRIGGVWIGLDSFGAMATPLRIALTMVNATKDGRGWNKTVGAGLSEVIDELPLFGDLTDTIKYMTTKPDQFATNALYNNVNKAMPALARNMAKIGFRLTGTTIETGDNRYLKKFARAYGLDGEELSYNDFLKFIYNRADLGVWNN